MICSATPNICVRIDTEDRDYDFIPIQRKSKWVTDHQVLEQMLGLVYYFQYVQGLCPDVTFLKKGSSYVTSMTYYSTVQVLHVLNSVTYMVL